MKYRAITFAFAACLVSSLAFADNPTDTQLMPNDRDTSVVQQENRASHKRRSQGKDESLAPNVKSENPATAKGQSGQSNPELPGHEQQLGIDAKTTARSQSYIDH